MSSPSRALRHATLLAASVVLAACGGGAARDAKAPQAGGDAPGEGTAAGPPGRPADLDCGDFTTCAVAEDGTAHCSGRDKQGELGDGAGVEERHERGVVPGVGKVKRLALASTFACAIVEDGSVTCWGTGRIANDGKLVEHARPTPVAGVSKAEELVASGVIACARGAGGISCWGADAATIGTPPRGSFRQISAGFSHACALDDAGAVTCWGQGDWGKGGAFARPAGIAGAAQLVTGDRHGCVLTKDRTVQCWGMNDAGQLGVAPNMKPHAEPVAVPGVRGVRRLAAGEASTCALLEDGAVQCWGANGEGELGLGRRSPDERPAAVTALPPVGHLCLATAHGCALTQKGELFCWGSNAFGQLGDGTTERRSAPTPVAW